MKFTLIQPQMRLFTSKIWSLFKGRGLGIGYYVDCTHFNETVGGFSLAFQNYISLVFPRSQFGCKLHMQITSHKSSPFCPFPIYIGYLEDIRLHYYDKFFHPRIGVYYRDVKHLKKLQFSLNKWCLPFFQYFSSE